MSDSIFDKMRLDLSPEPKSTCKGGVYRARENVFVSVKGAFFSTRSATPLKRDSCPGCKNCWPWEGDLHEFTANGDYPDFRPRFIDGAKYRLDVVDIGRDYETGWIDEWYLAFVLIEDEK